MPGRIRPDDIRSSNDSDLYSDWPPPGIIRPPSYAVRLPGEILATDGPPEVNPPSASLTGQPSTDNPSSSLHNDFDWILLDVEGDNGNDIFFRPDRTSGGTDFFIRFNVGDRRDSIHFYSDAQSEQLAENDWIDDICTRGVTPLPYHRNQRESLQQAMNSRFTGATSEGRNGIEVDHPSMRLMEESLRIVYRDVIVPNQNSRGDR
ncbi:uncharacterized protein L203_105875 [Cryptococcus depauperatus CBS 7841]|uniref:Uncharacterized protein n=1 Tax=Cryptococcus depauperatus CBS 7841 TaxID=1295531 RepID=A0A1E3I9Z4_9TREE|nr:hypothetical protein L203_05030 [Cryptococcus depauperatus CBS 7841]